MSIRELTVGGLFAALIAVGAFIKITLPTEPIPMHFTLQWFFVLLAGLMLDRRLAGFSADRVSRSAGICFRRRSGVSASAGLRLSPGICRGCIYYGMVV